jgi:hypothetical protein
LKTVVSGVAVGAEALASFLQTEGSRKQFFPVVDHTFLLSTQWKDLHLDDFKVAVHKDKIVGCVALWDQLAFRQIKVVGFSRTFAVCRPALNSVARLLGFPGQLPNVGEDVKNAYVTLCCVKDNDTAVALKLLRHLILECKKRGIQFLTVTLHEKDPLNKILCRCNLFHIPSRLYCACWEDGEAFYKSLDPTRVPHIEGGLL